MSPSRRLPPVTLLCVFAVVAASSPVTPAAGAPDEKLKALNEKIDALRRQYDATPWPADTPEAIGKLLKHDPGACAGFVRRSMRYEPYAGVLRGGRGALAAGGGNSADLSLLLRDMLAGGSPAPEMRYAIAELSDQQARGLVDRAMRASAARPGVASMAGTKPPALAASTGRPELARSATAGRRQLLADLNTAAAQIEAALRESIPQPPDPRADAAKAARTHVWLQVRSGAEWLSLDPAAGVPLPASGVRHVDRLPNDWDHSVALTIEVERLDTAELARETLLERRWPSAVLGGRPVELMILPADLSVSKMIDPTAGGAGNFLEQAKSFKRFATRLSLPGEKPLEGKAFGLDGRIDAASLKAGPTGVTAFDPFKRFPGGRRGAAPGPAPSGDLAGLWLTITTTSPGAPPVKVERALLDRLGPDARSHRRHEIADAWKDPLRAAASLLQRYQLLVSTGTVGATRAGRDAIEAALLDQPLLQRAVELEAGADAKALDAALKQFTPPSFPSDLIAVNDTSIELAQARLLGRGICYVARPNLYVRTESLDLSPDGAVISRNVIDVTRHELAVLAEPSRVWRTRLLHGLAASELEGRVLDGAVAATSAARLLRAGATEVGLRPIRGAKDIGAVAADADTKAVMAAALRDSAALLVPAEPQAAPRGAVVAAWWKVTRDGHVIAVGADGRGQAATEGGMILTDVSIPQVKNCMTFVACLNKGVAGGGAMVQTAANCWAEQVKDVAKEVLDNALEQMIGDPFADVPDDDGPPPEPGTIGHLRDAPFQEPDEQSYYELYQEAREALDELKKRTQEAQAAIDNPLGQLPGVAEGQSAADAGAEIGSALGTRLYLLLAMGHDIAEFASKPIAD